MSTNVQHAELYKAIIGKKRGNYYLRQFESFDARGGGFYPSWNWAAFFLVGLWALYRRMYAIFFAVFGFILAWPIIVFALTRSLPLGVNALLIGGLLLVLFLGFLALMPGFGLYGNALYYKHAKRKVAKAQITLPADNELLSYLASEGGVGGAGVWLIVVILVMPFAGLTLATILLLIPMGEDFTPRARVSEASSLASAARTAVDIAYSEGYPLGNIPSQASLGLAAPASYSSKYVASVATDAAGRVIVHLTDHCALADAKNGIVTFVPSPQGGNLVWTPVCSFEKLCPKK